MALLNHDNLSGLENTIAAVLTAEDAVQQLMKTATLNLLLLHCLVNDNSPLIEKDSFLISLGSGTWWDGQCHSTSLQIFTAVSSKAIDICINRCCNETETLRAKELLLEWCSNSVWRGSGDALLHGEQFPQTCKTMTSALELTTKLLAAHSRRSNYVQIATKLLHTLPIESQFDQPTSIVIDPKRLSACSVAYVLNRLGWVPRAARLIVWSDAELLQPLLAIMSNAHVAVKLFAALDRLPPLCAKLVAQGDKYGLKDVLDALTPTKNLSLNTLPTSIFCSSVAWWDSIKNLRVLAEICEGATTRIPFSSLLLTCVLVRKDYSKKILREALVEAYTIYTLARVIGVSIDPKRRSMLLESGPITTVEWAALLFNDVCFKLLAVDPVEELTQLIPLLAASESETNLLLNSLSGTNAVPQKIQWRALLQAARATPNSPCPDLFRFVAPDILTSNPEGSAALQTVFELWWGENHTLTSMLISMRLLIAEYAFKLASQQKAQISCHYCPKLLSDDIIWLGDTEFVEHMLIEKKRTSNDDKISCRVAKLGLLWFILTGRNKIALDYSIQCNCSSVMLLYSLWTNSKEDAWKELLVRFLTQHASNSDESLHVMSVCSCLSLLSSHKALALLNVPEIEHCDRLRGTDFMEHVVGGLLNPLVDSHMLLNIQRTQEIIQNIAECPSSCHPRLTLEAALQAAFETSHNRKYLNVLGTAMWNSVTRMLQNQAESNEKLSRKCEESLNICREKAKISDKYLHLHRMSLSSTICDICGDVLTADQEAEVSQLEKLAFNKKVVVMTCQHHFHAMCLRSMCITLLKTQKDSKNVYSAYQNLISLHQSYERPAGDDDNLETELIK